MKSSKQSVRIIKSLINEELHIVKQGSKKLLNTKNTNYSYGTLVDVLEHGLDSLPVKNMSSVLLLGMGGGSIIQSLREKYKCKAPVTAVEIDPVVVEIAHKEFDIQQYENIEIHCMDAWEYVKTHQKKFDLVIIDIFIDTQVPKGFYTPQFWRMLKKNVKENGYVLFNAGIDKNVKKIQKFVRGLPDRFIYQKNYNVLRSNTLVIMQKTS